MKFCRHCGTVLQQAPQGLPPSPGMGMYGSPGGAPGAPPGGGYGYGAPPPGGPLGGPPPGSPMGVAPTMAAPGGLASTNRGVGGPGGSGGVVAGSIGGASAPAAMPSACPRCGAPTQPGFMFCQQCGTKLTPGGPGVDAHAGTLAASGPIAAGLRGSPAAPTPMPPPQAPMPPPQAPMPPPPSAQQVGLAPTPAAGGWGTAVSVNRDGTDGDRYPLSGEFVVIGRMSSSGADIVFENDRFLARQHARLEATPDGAARVVPLDTLNGVYRKIDAPVPLSDGMIVLAGREVLRYEVVDADEKNGTPLIRHGVALFGSPPREPWGRLLQLLPSGGIRDIRHLWDDEIVIGREDGDLVFADDQFLSRRHASIAWDGARATLSDLGSSNGTFVRLAGPMSVKHGDHLRMGDQLFRIELRR